MPKPKQTRCARLRAMPNLKTGRRKGGGMAYRLSIKKSCANCGGVAVVEVFNNKNASYGFYCDRCGTRRVKEIEEVENAAGKGK